MKNKIALLFLGIVVSLASCTTEPPEPPTPGNYDPLSIEIAATTLNQATRSIIDEQGDPETGRSNIKTKWQTTDQIGIYVQFKDELDRSGDYKVSTIEDNGSTARFTGPFKWKDSGLPHMFYAYYPKIVSPAGTPLEDQPDYDPTMIPISLPAVQQQIAAGNEYLNDYNFMIAQPASYTSPKSFEKESNNHPMKLDMMSVFSIIEFRLGSYKLPGLKINRVVVTSQDRDIAVDGGTIDITKPSFDKDFGKITGGTRSKTITLDITDPMEVPISERKYVIPGNQSRMPANTDLCIPARIMVMPNSNQALNNPDQEEKWTIDVYGSLHYDDLQDPSNSVHDDNFHFTREVYSRVIKPGERHAIVHVVLTTPGVTEVPIDEAKGDPWVGWTDLEEPNITAQREIEITKPSHLGWLSRAVNENLPSSFTPPTDPTFEGHTLKIKNNINLGNVVWEPIGIDQNKCFAGNIDAENPTPEEGYPDSFLISGFNLTYTLEKPVSQQWVGLFAYVKSPKITNLRVEGNISIGTNSYSDNLQVGGIVGHVHSKTSFENCHWKGDITVLAGTSSFIGGISGASGTNNSEYIECSSEIKNFVLRNSLTNNSAYGYAGGITGATSSSFVSINLKGCEFKKGSKITANGSWRLGGIIGYMNGGSVKACKNAADIMVSGINDQVGGIVGHVLDGSIIACYNTGSITVDNGSTGANYPGVGGIVGAFQTGRILRACFSTGRIDPSREIERNAGNIVGNYTLTLAGTNYDFSKIKNNYHIGPFRAADTNEGLDIGDIEEFSPVNWPDPDVQDGWGTGDGSDDNKLWHPYFPDSYGTDEYSYPQLYWETIE